MFRGFIFLSFIDLSLNGFNLFLDGSQTEPPSASGKRMHLKAVALVGATVKNPELLPLWSSIRALLVGYEAEMLVVRDEPGYFSLKTETGRPFVSLVIQKKHVGLYSMPLYENDSLAEELESARIGKSCLGFVEEDDVMLDLIESFLQRSFMHYVYNGLIR